MPAISEPPGSSSRGIDRVAAPFVVIMVLLCVAFMRDLNHDPVILRQSKGLEVVEQAVDYGTERHGEDFYLRVRAFPITGTRRVANGESSGPTYAAVRSVQDPFTEETTDQEASAHGAAA